MSVTEFPKFGKPRVPNGTFVIFSFDPASYANDLDDAKAREAAAQIERKKYLGLIETPGPLDLPRLRLNLDLRVAGLAPPQESEDDMYDTSPARCVPIFPATAHPDGRAPLVPSNALPWAAGCYLHTLQLVNAFVSRVHHANPTNAVVSAEELARVRSLVTSDEQEAAKQRPSSDVGSYYGSEDGMDGASYSSSQERPFEKPFGVYVEIWEDLTVATSLGEPKDVGRDIDEIMAIGEEWEKRMNQEYRAKAPQTSRWAEGVADSGHEECAGSFLSANGSPTPENSPDPLGDAPTAAHVPEDDIAPEDAVDERARNGADAIRRDDPVVQETAHPVPQLDGTAVPLGVPSNGVATVTQTVEDDSSVHRLGTLRFATAKARQLKEWLRQTLHM